MAKQAHGNFAFLYEKDPVTYQDMLELESQLRIDYHWTGLRIRGALEMVLQKVVEKHGLQSKLPDRLVLPRKLLKLLNYEFLGLPEPVLPCAQDIVTFGVIGENGELAVGKDTCYNFLLKLGNAFRLKETAPGTPEQSYPNTVHAIRQLHKILVQLYDAGAAPEFDTERMPYGPYITDVSDAPADVQGSCFREVLAHTEKANGDPEKYALLRVYRHSRQTPALQQTLEDRYWALRKATPCQGLPPVQKLTPNTKDLPFFVMAYDFYKDARMLNNRLLKSLELPQRLALCKSLAETFCQLHKVPLYHGGVDPTCVFVYSAMGRLIPWVTKFDREPFRATEALLDHDHRVLTFLARYIPPERGRRDLQADPAKADVYALGVLLGDILYGQFDGAMLPGNVYFHVTRLPIPVPVGRIVGQMVLEDPALRPTMAQVLEAF